VKVIELTGCTGSGKTTLCEELVRQLLLLGLRDGDLRVLPPPARSLWRLTPQGVRNVAAEARLVTQFPAACAETRAFLGFAARAASRQPESTYFAIRAFRGALRHALRLDAMRQSRATNAVLIADELTIQSAHYLFANPVRPPRRDQVERFCEIVPLPDVVLYVDAPAHVLVERMLSRPDPPRRALDAAAASRYVDHVLEVYDVLQRSGRIAERLLRVEIADPRHCSLSDAARVTIDRLDIGSSPK